MKEKLNEIKENLSRCGELINNNIENDFAFSYGEIYDMLLLTLKEMKEDDKVLKENEKDKILDIFFDNVIRKIEIDMDKKNIAFNVNECKELNALLYEGYKGLEDMVDNSTTTG